MKAVIAKALRFMGATGVSPQRAAEARAAEAEAAATESTTQAL